MKLKFRSPAGGVVVLTLCVLVASLCSEARADGFSVGYGLNFASFQAPCHSGSLIFGQDVSPKWEALVVIAREGRCYTKQTGLKGGGGLLGVGIMRWGVTPSGKWAFGIGAALWEKDSFFFGDADGVRDDIQLSGLLAIERRFLRCGVFPRCGLFLPFHASTGQSSPTNKGLNIMPGFRVMF